ncbi:hypothetical protein LXL04_027508 [Taraxacum kok-saghyz]
MVGFHFSDAGNFEVLYTYEETLKREKGKWKLFWAMVHVVIWNIWGADETKHLFIDCPFAKDVLERIWTWCKIPMPNINWVEELVTFAVQWGRCPKKRKILIAIIYGFLWNNWKARNNKVFNKVHVSTLGLVDNILSKVFGWINYGGETHELQATRECKLTDRNHMLIVAFRTQSTDIEDEKKMVVRLTL